ncbi:MAG: GFA family protein [Pseudomonadota bacterium]
MTKEKFFATGQCLCGDVKYTITAKPVRFVQCHCDDCRRTTGTGHTSNAFFKQDAVNIIGETHSHAVVTDTGSIISRYFCPRCGSHLFGKSSVFTKFIGISAGTLDDSSWFKADVIVYNKRKPAWDFMDNSITTYEEMPPPRSKKHK